MFESKEALKLIREIGWEPDRIVSIIEGPYRYRIVVHCLPHGRQKAVFADGNEHPYFCYTEIIAGNGKWIERGAAVVPVLPDGRFIMVVEQRPPQWRFPDRPMIARISGRQVDLAQFGPYSSLEFPGGAVDPGEGLKSGFLRELQEESGIENQTALFYRRVHPIYVFGADIPIQQFLGVAVLSGLKYPDRTETDGGLAVLALSEEDVDHNIHTGVIHSGQAALNQWSFWQEVRRARHDSSYKLIECC